MCDAEAVVVLLPAGVALRRGVLCVFWCVTRLSAVMARVPGDLALTGDPNATFTVPGGK